MSAGAIVVMATELCLAPGRAAMVERARGRAPEVGEVRRGTFAPCASRIPPIAVEVIRKWRRYGADAEAVARIAADG